MITGRGSHLRHCRVLQTVWEPSPLSPWAGRRLVLWARCRHPAEPSEEPKMKEDLSPGRNSIKIEYCFS